MTLTITDHKFLFTITVFHGKVTKASGPWSYLIGFTLPHLYRHAEEREWVIQTKEQALKAKRKKAKACVECGKPAVTDTFCLKHAVQKREGNKNKKGWYKPYRCKSRVEELARQITCRVVELQGGGMPFKQ